MRDDAFKSHDVCPNDESVVGAAIASTVRSLFNQPGVRARTRIELPQICHC
jgi:hypothetical protein